MNPKQRLSILVVIVLLNMANGSNTDFHKSLGFFALAINTRGRRHTTTTKHEAIQVLLDYIKTLSRW